LRKRFCAALKRAKLRRLRVHDLRHALGSAAITKLDPYAVQSHMGHQALQHHAAPPPPAPPGRCRQARRSVQSGHQFGHQSRHKWEHEGSRRHA
jgi:hypothetical protein